MQNRLRVTVLMAAVLAAGQCIAAQDALEEAFAGQDLHLTAGKMTIYHAGPDGQEPDAYGDQILLFEDGFSGTIGDNHLTADSAVVWITLKSAEHLGVEHLDYHAQLYLEKNVSVQKGDAAKATYLKQMVVERGEALLTSFLVTGEVFATVQTRSEAAAGDLKKLAIYNSALAVLGDVSSVRSEPAIAEDAVVPGPAEKPQPLPAPPPARVQREPEPEFKYPVNLSAVWQRAPVIEQSLGDDGTKTTSIIGRFYLWQKKDEQGGLVEFQADRAVVFSGSEQFKEADESAGDNLVASGQVSSVYFAGNVVMTEGTRTMRADEVFYDFEKSRALVVDAEMRTFDPKRAVPVYLRAEKLRQVSESVFEADRITLTTSEFYIPQVAMTASKMVLTDTTNIDARSEKGVDKSSYEGVLRDVRLKMDDRTVFYWPKIRTNFERPDLPIRKIRIGNDSEFGTSVETRWYLARLLGRKESPGVDSTLAVDYFGKRGAGVGVTVEYQREKYFGNVIGYILSNRGTDDLGRTSDRKNVDPGEDIRGRFRFQHRHFLPYDWQATVEASYASDKNFLEWFYRSEFNTGKAQETLIHLKRLKDNWGFSLLNKFRITDHRTLTEELPTVEFHLKGASFWDHRLTYYSDSQVSRMRNRFAPDDADADNPEQFFTFAFTRHEVDMPILWDTVRVTPFVAGTYAIDDQDGFRTRLDNTAAAPDEAGWFSEAGVRVATMFYGQNQFVKSRLWDLNGIRHIIRPHFEAVAFDSSDQPFQMRDMMNFGVSQRWQTRRGPKENLRSLDWMRLDIDSTWLSDDINNNRPAKFIWNDSSIPTALRRTSGLFGTMRDSVNADYTWRISDTATILSDINYDIEDSRVQQYNIGITKFIYPDISYYIASRYLKPVTVSVPTDDIFEQGSHSLVTALTYALNPRYTLMFSQEYNTDYGKNVSSDISLMRRYH
ncbi:MAG: LPS-assembly protein LptD, partial [Planctomycetes bacterium]|nr:LPS-assembly protein LptD [Planctomycetota bacterium]